MPEGNADRGDIDMTAVTGVKRSDGQIQRLTMDDEERLRVIAALLVDQDGNFGFGNYLADFKELMEDILIELRIANAQRAEMGNLAITKSDIEGEGL